MSKKVGKDPGHFSSAYSLSSPAQTKAHYTTWSKTYDAELGDGAVYAQPSRAAEMLTRFQPDRLVSVLDAGCGSGLSGKALYAAGYSRLTGCDFSPQMLQKAAEKEVYKTLFEADLNAPLSNIGDDEFDVVTCVGVFSFGHVSPDACDELLRIIRPNGLFIIALNEKFWDKGDLAAKLEQLSKAGKIETLAREYGDHLPHEKINGWVLALRKI